MPVLLRTTLVVFWRVSNCALLRKRICCLVTEAKTANMAIEASNESALGQAILNNAIVCIRGCSKLAICHETHRNVAVATSAIFIIKYFKIRSVTTLTLSLQLGSSKGLLPVL